MPSCSLSSGLSTGEQCPQPFLAPTSSSCQHKVGGTKDCSGEQRAQDSGNPHLLLDPAMLSSHSPGQGGTHHIGHIRRGSTLQQGLDDGQMPHEGGHMQGGQARLWREKGQEPRWGLTASATSLPAPSSPSLGHAPAEANSGSPACPQRPGRRAEGNVESCCLPCSPPALQGAGCGEMLPGSTGPELHKALRHNEEGAWGPAEAPGPSSPAALLAPHRQQQESWGWAAAYLPL